MSDSGSGFALLHRLRAIPIGALCSANVTLLLLWWAIGVFAPQTFARLDTFPYPPSILIVTVPIIMFLPYYVVTREDSGHWIAYAFSYLFIVGFSVQDIQLLWLLVRH
jgi:hypothetical protein